ncbi:MAG: hypothetical protein WDA09_10280 [Bacteriovoracaceae bacterium]
MLYWIVKLTAMCREDDFKNVHIVLIQKNTILLATPEDIFDRLEKRIEATLDLH